MPKMNDGLSPEENFSRMFQRSDRLMNIPAWGCPACVLQPTLQDGKKLGHLKGCFTWLLCIGRWELKDETALLQGPALFGLDDRGNGIHICRQLRLEVQRREE